MRSALLRRRVPNIMRRGIHTYRHQTTPLSMSLSSSSSFSSLENTDHEVSDLIHEYASKPQTPISLKDMMMMTNTNDVNDSGQMLMQMAEMLQDELPVRLAHRIQDLDSLSALQEMPSVQQVHSIYLSSFLDLVQQAKPSSPQAEHNFGVLLQNLYQNHSNVLRQMARGVLELKFQQQRHPGLQDHHRLSMVEEAFLDRFYMSRVGIRVLAGQYLALRHQLLLNNDDIIIPEEYVGMINRETSPHRVVQRAIEDATILCQQQFGGEAPKVHVSGRLQLTFCYIPTHLHYILLELLKNSMRATMEFHKGNSKPPPPIRVVIADGKDNEDVIIKVSDQGGGIPRSETNKIWSYLFTTAPSNVQEEFFHATKQLAATENGPILAGLGYGLPLSRAYARCFGGDLDLVSMEGYGTDAFCHLVRLADRAPKPE